MVVIDRINCNLQVSFFSKFSNLIAQLQATLGVVVSEPFSKNAFKMSNNIFILGFRNTQWGSRIVDVHKCNKADLLLHTNRRHWENSWGNEGFVEVSRQVRCVLWSWRQSFPGVSWLFCYRTWSLPALFLPWTWWARNKIARSYLVSVFYIFYKSLTSEMLCTMV